MAGRIEVPGESFVEGQVVRYCSRGRLDLHPHLRRGGRSVGGNGRGRPGRCLSVEEFFQQRERGD